MSNRIQIISPPKKSAAELRKERFDAWYNRLKEVGYDGKQDADAMQQWTIATPERKAAVAKWMHDNPPVAQTNKGRKAFGDKKWEDYSEDEYITAYHDGVFDYNDPVPGRKEWKDLIESTELAMGNKFVLDNTESKKNQYNKQPLPFQQTIPELAGFASALNTYNYQTPDYTHWEVTPNKLNIQPQLQSIDSSLNAINATTTGNPQVDNARKVAAFSQAVAAKQQPYGAKQNYDSTQEYEAQKINNPSRTQEQQLDANAMSTVYNEYMSTAKDAATAERIKAISSLSKKYALNQANENKKKLMIDNFYNNVEVDANGNLKVRADGWKIPDFKYREDAKIETPDTIDGIEKQLSDLEERKKALLEKNSSFVNGGKIRMPFTKQNTPSKNPFYENGGMIPVRKKYYK